MSLSSYRRSFLAATLLLVATSALRPPVAPAGDAAPLLKLKVEPASRLALVGDDGTTVHLRIVVTGLDGGDRPAVHAPKNLSLVLDKSGSMNADEKWGYVRRAVEDVFDRMGVDDVFSLVLYDTNAQVVIPPTRHLDAQWARTQLAKFRPGGSTALYAGLELGAKQVRDRMSDATIPRVILLSDGLANVGPSSPNELRALAEQLSGHGLRVSTIGVGADYNEDLMLGIAKDSGGSYYFIDDPTKIPTIFDEELSELSTIVARDVELIVELPEGVRCERSLDKGDDVRREGRRVSFAVPAISARRSTSLLLELKLDATADIEAAVQRALADVQVSYRSTEEGASPRQIAEKVEIGLTRDAAAVAASTNEEVAAEVLRFQMVDNRERAMAAMDAGNESEARALWATNVMLFEAAPASLQSSEAVKAQVQDTEADKDAYEGKEETARKQAQYSIYKQRK